MSSALVKIKKESIPEVLIYEMDAGQPIYYKGYQDVLNKTKTAEQIMGSSALQSLLVTLIANFLNENLEKKYRHFVSELGFKFQKKSLRSLDIAIYDMSKIKDKSIFFKNKYIEVPPVITIEIDTKADLSNLPDPTSYFTKKNRPIVESWSRKSYLDFHRN